MNAKHESKNNAENTSKIEYMSEQAVIEAIDLKK